MFYFKDEQKMTDSIHISSFLMLTEEKIIFFNANVFIHENRLRIYNIYNMFYLFQNMGMQK